MIKSLIIFLFFFAFSFLFYFLKLDIASAQNNNIVEAYLLIPDDWTNRISSHDMIRYKETILKGLKDTQEFYASKLNGHTFTYDTNVKVNARPIGSFDLSKEGCAGVLVDQLSLSDFRTQFQLNGRVRLFFVIGSANRNSCAHTRPNLTNLGRFLKLDEREVFMNHQHLEMLGDKDEKKHSTGLRALAHELGHAFGLVFAGWAGAHTCSIEQKDWCIAIPGLGSSVPYPPASECTNSIMSYCQLDEFYLKGFNNSIYNPEIQKIYKSPFINPNGDPAPNPITPQRKAVITSLSPDTLEVGSELTIKGEGLGNFKENVSTVALTNVGYSSQGITWELRSWQESEIKLILKSYPYNYSTGWVLTVVTDKGEKVEDLLDIVIPGEKISKATVTVPLIQSKSPSPSPIRACRDDCVATPDACDRINGVPAEGTCSIGICCKKSATLSLTPTSTPVATQTPTPVVTPSPHKIICLTFLDIPPAGCTKVQTSGTSVVFDGVRYSCGSLTPYECPQDASNASTSTPTPTPAPTVSPIVSTDIPCGSGGICKNGSCLIGDAIDPSGVCPLAEQSTPTPTPTPTATPVVQQVTKKEITKITVNDRKNVQEITSNFTQALNIRLPGTEGVAGTYPLIFNIAYNDGTSKLITFTFNYKPVAPITTSTPSPDVQACQVLGGVCQSSCSGEFSAQVGTCPSKNQLCCAKPVVTPSSNVSKCVGSGPAEKEWGGTCTPGEADKAVSTSNGTACSVASCYFKSDINEYCWYNSGIPYADYEGCKAKGVIISTSAPTSASTAVSDAGQCSSQGGSCDPGTICGINGRTVNLGTCGSGILCCKNP